MVSVASVMLGFDAWGRAVVLCEREGEEGKRERGGETESVLAQISVGDVRIHVYDLSWSLDLIWVIILPFSRCDLVTCEILRLGVSCDGWSQVDDDGWVDEYE